MIWDVNIGQLWSENEFLVILFGLHFCKENMDMREMREREILGSKGDGECLVIFASLSWFWVLVELIYKVGEGRRKGGGEIDWVVDLEFAKRRNWQSVFLK